MNNDNEKIKLFTDLYVWQKGHILVIEIYHLTEKFPTKETYGLSNQLRRAAVSITSNIAEGFNRQSKKEKIQFYSISCGSTAEVQNQIIISKDLGYITNKDAADTLSSITEVSKMLNGLIKSIR